MTRILRFLVSNAVSLVLLLVLAISMAVATFVENDHGTAVARSLVYEAWWFELLLVWLSVNFLVNLKRYKLLTRKRWPVALFHLAFVIIIIGAGVTRYTSNEGMIHIREGQTEHVYYTSERYLQLHNVEQQQSVWEEPLTLNHYRFSPYTTTASTPAGEVEVTVVDYLKGATPTFVDGNDTLIDIAFTRGGQREDQILQPGEVTRLGALALSTGSRHADIRLFPGDTSWMITADSTLITINMRTQQPGVLHRGDTLPVEKRTLYQWNSGAFMVKGIYEGAQQVYVSVQDEKRAENLPDAVALRVVHGSDTIVDKAFVELVNVRPQWITVPLGQSTYSLTYGPRAVSLPFALKLRRFELERYPGSQSPASYASEVQVVDGETTFPYRIYMNNVLDYRGYRFYQASYDTDEKGTVLSINQDRPGTWITYLGYLLLTVGMFFTLFTKGSRFLQLNKKLNRLKTMRVPLVLVVVLSSMALSAQPGGFIVPEKVADDYGRLIVQDLDGRMKPLNTLAGEIVRKLSGSTSMDLPMGEKTLSLTPEQFLLATQLQPEYMMQTPLLKADEKKGRPIYDKLDVPVTGTIAFNDCLDEEGNYLLFDEVEAANKLKPGERNSYHNELLKFDERFNILYGLLNGSFLRLFPDKEDANHTWYTAQDWQQLTTEEDATFVRNIIPLYLKGLQEGLQTGQWDEAEQTWRYIDMYQRKAGEEVYPSEQRIAAEMLYNRLNLGVRLFGPFWLLGTLLLILSLALLFFPRSQWMRWSWNILAVLGLVGFLLFTFHLLLRWYIAKHPPWSDGFEMLVFVAWGVLLFGYAFFRKTRFTIPLGLLFAGTLLFVAFLDWLNPEITNLMPVLHSYWLKIHVAVIVSGYAPLALSAVMGLLSLVLIIFRPQMPSLQWITGLQELRMVNEMSMTIGLFLLTVGTFLGGVWANESWGRYWAWDPKETWALISIVVYAFVLHLRLVPLKRPFLIFQIASLWAFSSIIMTSFGVNYYLSGLHSYAKGDPVPIPDWVIWVTISLFVVTVVAIIRYRPVDDPSAIQEKENTQPE